MNKIARKLGVAAIVLATIVSVSGIVPAVAQTPAPADPQARINALLLEIEALRQQLGAPTAPAAPAFNFTRNLTLGSTGEDVRALQQFLNARGFTVATSGAGSVGNESTFFGARTQSALAKFQAANQISPARGVLGPITRTRIANIAPVAPVVPVAPVIAPMSVTLATDNPVAANLQMGSANNQVLKLVLTGGATPVSVTGITLRSYGTTEATGSVHIPAVKLFDENGVQVGSNRTPAGNQVNFTIVPALTIPANGSRTLTVTANIGTGAQVMSVVRYGVESATAITGETFTGTFPLIGNSFTIVPGGQLGSLTVGQFGSLPSNNVRVGDKNVVLERFNVSAGSNEDIAVNQVVLRRTKGTDTNVVNLRLRRVGETGILAGPISFANRNATFNLVTPVNLVRGASINLEVIGDISDAIGGPFASHIMEGGVVGRGTPSGTNVTSTGNTNAEDITLANERVSVSMSPSHPQGLNAIIVRSANRMDLAKFDVRAIGGNVIFNAVDLIFNAEATDLGTGGSFLSSVGIYDGDSLISDLRNVNVETAVTFSLNYTIPANTTRTLTVKGITNNLALAGGPPASATLTVNWNENRGFGLNSGEALIGGIGGTGLTPNITASALTVHPSGTVALSNDAVRVPRNQVILAPSTGAIVGAVRLQAQREDMRLTGLILTAGGMGVAAGDIANITLYAEDGTTRLTNPVSSATLDYTIGSADILNDIVVARGAQPRTILVRANVNSGLAVSTGVTFSINAGNADFIGQNSGESFANASAFNLAVTSPHAGGTFSSSADVLTIARNAASPSGTVSRTSETVTGIWDVVNHSATATTLRLTDLTFTSRTGLPAGLTDGADDLLFVLRDGDGNQIDGNITTDVTLAPAAGTVRFINTASPNMLTIAPGETKQLRLIVDATSTSKFVAGTEFHWSIETIGHTNVEGGDTQSGVGFAAGTWSIPAVANIVKL